MTVEGVYLDGDAELSRLKVKTDDKNKDKVLSHLSACHANVDGIYEEALDDALWSEDIFNIGLTGAYGCGKSSLWKGYSSKKNIKCLSVCLGAFWSEINGSEIDKKSSIEKYLINQIVVQIPQDKIQLSKFLLKENKTSEDIKYLVRYILCVIAGLGLVFFVDLTMISRILGAAFFLFGLRKLMYRYISKHEIKINRIKFSNTEAEFDSRDEIGSVFDKDIKELIYVISNMEENIIIFEDLDRLEDKSILIKLRELNFILNRYNRRIKRKPIKFIYMVREDIFTELDKTKFFDLIIPVIPIVNRLNSEEKLRLELGDDKTIFRETFIRKISYYISDMRLIKNIVNEYKIYYKALSIEDLFLNLEILFALITMKNIMPHHFLDMQNNKGKIVEFINQRDELIDILNKNLKDELEILNKEKERKNISRIKELRYEILRNENLSLIKLLSIFKDKDSTRLSCYLEDFTVDERSFISFLIYENLLREDYHYYIGYFYNDILSENDRKYLYLFREESINISHTKLDNPIMVYNRLKDKDFINPNIFNRDIIKCMIYFEHYDRFESFFNNVVLVEYNKIGFAAMISRMDNRYFRAIGMEVFRINPVVLNELVDIIFHYSQDIDDEENIAVLFREIITYKIKVVEIHLLKSKINRVKYRFLSTEFEESGRFMDNMYKLGIKFDNLRDMALADFNNVVLVNSKGYEKTIDNIMLLIENIEKKKYVFDNLITTIFGNKKFMVMKEYIEEDFEKFLEDYINYDIEPKEFRNSKEDTLKILNSGISDETKELFRKYNKTIVDEE